MVQLSRAPRLQDGRRQFDVDDPGFFTPPPISSFSDYAIQKLPLHQKHGPFYKGWLGQEALDFPSLPFNLS